MTQVTIKRRVLKDEKYVEVTEKATLIKKNTKTCWVRLGNGDVIKRKKKDVELWQEK